MSTLPVNPFAHLAGSDRKQAHGNELGHKSGVSSADYGQSDAGSWSTANSEYIYGDASTSDAGTSSSSGPLSQSHLAG